MAYKTSAQDAAALATKWYQQGLGRAPDAQGLQHWIGEIQKDGSNTAWQNFSASPEAQQAGAAAKFTAAKVNPIELTPGAGQLPGTNMKNISNTWGVTAPPAVADGLRIGAEALGSTFGIPPQLTGAVVGNLGHGAINNLGQVVGRGLTGAVQGAMVGGALQGAQAGQGIGGTIAGAAKGALNGALNPWGNYTNPVSVAGTVAGAAGNGMSSPASNVPGVDGTPSAIPNGAIGQPSGSPPSGGWSIPNGALGAIGGALGVPGMGGAGGSGAGGQNPNQPQSVAGLLGGLAGKLGGVTIPGVTQNGGQPVSVGGLLGQAGNFLGGNNGLNALMAAQAANAAYLGQKSTNYAQNALDTQQTLFDNKGGLRAAGIAGMQNPVTPNLSNLGQISQSGNPFARPIPVSKPAGSL